MGVIEILEQAKKLSRQERKALAIQLIEDLDEPEIKAQYFRICGDRCSSRR